MDSSLSGYSNTSSLSSSWGGFGPSSPKGFLYRASSLPTSHVSAPVAIPGRAPRASADGAPGPFIARGSMTIHGSAFAADGRAPGTSPPGAGSVGAVSAAADAAAGDAAARARLPALVRSLSKGLSASLDFR